MQKQLLTKERDDLAAFDKAAIDESDTDGISQLINKYYAGTIYIFDEDYSPEKIIVDDRTILDIAILSNLGDEYPILQTKVNGNSMRRASGYPVEYKVENDEITAYLKNVFNLEDEAIRKLVQYESSFEYRYYYFDNGDFYYTSPGIGMLTDVTPTIIKTDGKYYYTIFDICDYPYDFQNPYYVTQGFAKLTRKERNGREYWSLYSFSKMSNDAGMWSVNQDLNEHFSGMATVNVDSLNVRSSASTSGVKVATAIKGRAYPVFEVFENDGYKWYRIGFDRWIADNGTWVSYSEY